MRTLFGLSILLSLASGPLARADSASDPLVTQGIQLRREHHDAEALEAFRRAFELEPAPRTRAQIALAEQALGQFVGAEKDLIDALSATDDGWIRTHAELLRKALDSIREHLATVAVETNVPDAELWVSGASVGTLPLAPSRVPAGEVEIELRRPGKDSLRRTVTVPAGTTVYSRFEFVEDAHPAPASRDGTASQVAHAESDAERQPATSRDGSSPPSQTTPSSTRRLVGYSLLAGAGALLIGAVVAQVIREQNVEHYNNDDLCLSPGMTRDELCGTYRGRAETATTLAIVGYVGAGALGLTAAALLLSASTPATAGHGVVSIQASNAGIYASFRGSL